MFFKTNNSLKGMRYLFLHFVLINLSIITVYSQDNCCGPGKGDRVKAMTLQYTGQGCSASSNNQGPIGDKWNCTGNPANDAEVYIVVNDMSGTDIGGDVYFSGNVKLNATFSAVSGNEMKSSVYIHIFNQQGGAQLQLLKIQAHCSVPIASGNQFGSIILVEAIFKNGYSCTVNDICICPAPNSACTPPNTWDKNVVANGTTSWSALGLGDPENVKQKIRISGTGKVIIPNNNVKLTSSGAVLFIDGPEFILNNGNLQLDVQGSKFLMVNGILRTFSNFQQTGNTVVCITGSEVEIGDEQFGGTFNTTGNKSSSANWQNDGGYRYLLNNCINVTHDYQLQSTGTGTGLNGVDVICNNCIEIGDRGNTQATPSNFGFADGDDSGNWQNSKNQTIVNTTIVVANGNYQNSGTNTLCDVKIKVNKSGSFQAQNGIVKGNDLCVAVEDIIENSGTWTLTGINWYSDKNNSTNLPGAGSETPKSIILSQCFAGCSCEDCDLSANAGPDVLICTGDFAFLNASPNGATPPYTYQWDNPPSNGPVKSVNPQQNTTYTVTVTDALGCRDTDDVLVQVGQKPAASAVNDGPVTCAKTTATLTAFPASGVTYLWSNGVTTRSTIVSIAGTYTVTVTDVQSACTSTAQTALTGSPQKPEVLIQNDGPLTCTKTSMIITAVTTGGNPPYTYQWNNNLGTGPVKTVSPQVATTYRVTVTDALGCTDEEAILVTPLNRPIASAVNDGPITCIKTTVNITASPATGVAYLWNTGSTNRTIIVSTNGTYTVTVTDLQSGCTSAAASSVVGDPGRPLLVLVNDGPVDCIKTSATITASATGGNAPYQFLWSNNLGTGSVKVVSPSQTTSYSVTVTDILGCTDSKSTTVTVLNKPVSSAVNDGPLTCAKTSVMLTAFPAIGVAYLWSNGGTTRTTTVNAAGSYSVTVTDLNSGCTSVASTTVTGDPTALQVSIRVDDEPDCENPAATLTALAIGATPPVQYVWNQNLGTGAVKTVTPIVPTTYRVTVTDGLGCTGTASVELQPPGKAKVGDFVWEDKNVNGCQDVGEPGVSGVSVKIYRSGSNVLISETTTNASGYYEFEVCAGTYYIIFGTWQNYERTAENACDDTKDSDANRSTGKTPDFTLRTGDFNRTIDAGFFNCIQVEMLVWYDINRNDIWDTNENGINQLEVNLWRKYDNDWRVWDVKYTGPKPGTPSDDGYCEYCPPSGEYYIEVVMPPQDLVRVQPNIGNNEFIDSDLTNAFGPATTDVFQVLPGMPVKNLAGGFYPMATAGNLVWVDSNLNGVQDIGEQKMQGILVEAYDVNTHEKLREAETNENGEYLMDYLEKRNVYLKFYPPQGYVATLPRRINDIQDSDVDHTFGPNTTRSFSMAPGMNNPQIDMGVAFGFLPVDWLDVYAIDKGKKNEIHWIVENEMNVSHYVVEKLNDEIHAFEPVSEEIRATDSGKRTERYMAYDENAQNSGAYIYRIQQVDFDGRETYSKQVRVLKNVNSKIEILPNPVRDQASLGIHLNQQSRVNVSLFDANGRSIMVIAEDVEMEEGKHALSIDARSIQSGVYYVRCEIDGDIFHIPLIRIE